jgi:hypothetical protein
MSGKENRRNFLEPELIKFEAPLDVVTTNLGSLGSDCTGECEQEGEH